MIKSMGILGNMENKLYLLGIDVPLKTIIELIGTTPEVESKVLLKHFYMFEYDQDTKLYRMWNIQNNYIVYGFEYNKDMFNKMEERGINFLGDIPLGNIHKSYTMICLELIRWVADVYYAKRHWEGLIKE